MNQRSKDLYFACEELAPEDRAAFLDRECPDAATRREVEALLVAAHGAEDLFGSVDTGPALLPDDPPVFRDPIGSLVGVYRLTELLGHGGMGSVYLGEREDGQFEQKVAVKLLATTVRHPDVQRRFLAEREILARFQHPGIATLFDGGVDEHGTPYFVMEYVPGEPIHAYCDHRLLDVRARVELFLQVCEALAHAHDQDVIHRDVKAQNVLVADGRVKLLDFGIAKLLQEDKALEQTATGMSPMTPAFASPEQLRGGRIAATSDVYSMGLLLYELLTGMRPYAPRGDSQVDLAEAILHDTVSRPSVRFARNPTATGGGRDRETLAQARQTTPQELRRRLRGDLDTIVLKALAKDPDRRYQDAGEVARDLQRYLTGHPIQARRDSLFYRGRRFVARHRAASALGLLALAIGAASLVRSIEHARNRSRGDQDLELERDRSDQLLEQLTALYKTAEPDASPGANSEARRFLDSAVISLRSDPQGDPRTRATLLFTAGEVYCRLADSESALPLLEEALELRQDLHESPHEDLADSHRLLSVALSGLERLDEALEHSDEAVEQERALHGDDHEHVATARYERALLEHDAMRGRNAEEDFREAVRIFRALESEPTTTYGSALLSLGDYLAVSQGPSVAVPLYEEGLDILIAVHGPRHSKVARGETGLGILYWSQERKPEAIELLESSVAIHREILGERLHPDLAAALQNLGSVLGVEDRLEEGLEALREACAIYDGLDTPATTRGYCWYVLGNTAQHGSKEEAQAAYEECLRIFAEGGVSPLFQAGARRSLGRLLLAEGSRERGLELLEQVADAYDSGFGSESPQANAARQELERARQE